MTLYLEVTADVIAHNQQNFFNSLFFTFSSSFKPFINILTLRSSSGKQFFSKRPKLFWQGIPGKVGFLWLVKTNPGEQQVDPITFLSVVVMPCAFNLYFALRESFFCISTFVCHDFEISLKACNFCHCNSTLLVDGLKTIKKIFYMGCLREAMVIKSK